jgi:DNA-binding NtrC family response regulator
MPFPLQAKLLRVLQDGSIQRLGGKEEIKTDVRIIAATNKELETLRDKGEFRDDLYWRLNVVSINLPPLRERKDDIREIAQYFMRKYNRELGKGIHGLSPELLEEFHEYNWPGNVRELQSIVQRGMVMCQKDVLSHDDCDTLSSGGTPEGRTRDMEKVLSEAAGELLQIGGADIYKEAVSEFERLLIKKALHMNKNNQALTARMLGISRNTLKAKLGKN